MSNKDKVLGIIREIKADLMEKPYKIDFKDTDDKNNYLQSIEGLSAVINGVEDYCRVDHIKALGEHRSRIFGWSENLRASDEYEHAHCKTRRARAKNYVYKTVWSLVLYLETLDHILTLEIGGKLWLGEIRVRNSAASANYDRRGAILAYMKLMKESPAKVKQAEDARDSAFNRYCDVQRELQHLLP